MLPPKNKNNKMSRKDIINYIYNRLEKAGFDQYSIAGVLGNAFQESSLNPDSISDNKKYHGLFQNSTDRMNRVKQLYGDHSLASQVQYVIDWVNNPKKVRQASVSDQLANNSGMFKRTGYKSPEEASDAFLRLYEVAYIKDKKGNIVGWQQEPQRRTHSRRMYNDIIKTKGKPVLLKDLDENPTMQSLPKVQDMQMPNIPYKEFTPDNQSYPLNNTINVPVSSWNGATAPVQRINIPKPMAEILSSYMPKSGIDLVKPMWRVD